MKWWSSRSSLHDGQTYDHHLPSLISIIVFVYKIPHRSQWLVGNLRRIFHVLSLLCILLPRLALSFSVAPKNYNMSNKNNNNNLENNSMNNNILCVGICSLDTLATLNEFPNPDAKLRSTSLTHAGGGNAANTAVAMSRLSLNTAFLKQQKLQINVEILSAIGNDSNGDLIISGLEEENVGTQFIERFHGDSPWSYIMIVGDTRTIIHQPSTRDLSVEYVQRSLFQDQGQHSISNYAAVHFDLRHPKAAIYVAEHCRKLQIPYSVDVERPRDGLLEIMAGASVVLCNENYVDLVLADTDYNYDNDNGGNENKRDNSDREKDIVKRFRKVLLEQAPFAKIGVMTLGGKGSCLITFDDELGDDDLNDSKVVFGTGTGNDYNNPPTINSPSVIQKHGALWCESFPDCTVVDTTGAGDAFQGGFLSAIWAYSMLTKDDDKSNLDGVNKNGLQVPTKKVVLGHALRIASRVAAKKIEREGARAGLPYVDTFIDSEFNAMMNL